MLVADDQLQRPVPEYPELDSAGSQRLLTSVEICAGGGGQALGLEQAGFYHRLLIELDRFACNTLRYNRPNWTVLQADLRTFSQGAAKYQIDGIDLVAGGVPCPPFS